jgi:hypothetical protein
MHLCQQEKAHSTFALHFIHSRGLDSHFSSNPNRRGLVVEFYYIEG